MRVHRRIGTTLLLSRRRLTECRARLRQIFELLETVVLLPVFRIQPATLGKGWLLSASIDVYGRTLRRTRASEAENCVRTFMKRPVKLPAQFEGLTLPSNTLSVGARRRFGSDTDARERVQ